LGADTAFSCRTVSTFPIGENCHRLPRVGKSISQSPPSYCYDRHPSGCWCCQKYSPGGSVAPLQKRLWSSKVPSDNNTTEPGDTTSPSSGDIPGSQTGGKKLAIVFTCTVCDTRSAKQFTENAYRNGVVIVQCPGCQNRHLIADNLGYFEEQEDGGWNIEKAMEKMGEHAKLVTNDNVWELSVEDIYGADAVETAKAAAKNNKES